MMNNDVMEMIGFYIMAVAEEKLGNYEYAKKYWEKIRNAGDTFEAVAETRNNGLFETEH